MRSTNNKTFCPAAWLHSHVEPSGIRKLCCVAREHPTVEADRFSKIDDFWNGEFMRQVRREMLAGEANPSCAGCYSNVMAQSSTYQHWWLDHYAAFADEILASTAEDGTTTLKPIAYDYRISNLCNLKCRMCYEGYSSGIEIEKKLMGAYGKNEKWLDDSFRKQRQVFKDVLIGELMEAIEDNRLREIYWAGGEPLYWKEHWAVLDRLIETGLAKKVTLRYNTNLMTIGHKGKTLRDYANQFEAIYVFASIDGTGKIGEWIRDGLVWDQWVQNMNIIKDVQNHPRYGMFNLDMTVTIPGLIDMHNMAQFVHDNKLLINFKSAYPDETELLTPTALPRAVLDKLVGKQIAKIETIFADEDPYQIKDKFISYLSSLLSYATHEERFPDWKESRRRSKARLVKTSDYRGDGTNGRLKLSQIYSVEPNIATWWDSF